MDDKKKCKKCGEYKEESDFHVNRSSPDGINYYCKKCIMETHFNNKGVSKELTKWEEGLLLQYLPYTHTRTNFICENPKAANKKDAKAYTLSKLAKEQGTTYSQVQRVMYKLTRLGLVSMLQTGVDGLVETNIIYKKDQIKDYFF